jgi:hypothetical protein
MGTKTKIFKDRSYFVIFLLVMSSLECNIIVMLIVTK